VPSLRNSLVKLDPKRYERIDPHAPVAQPVEPFRPNPAPQPPVAIRRSTVMISSLPIISTNVDGVMRQFYGGPNVPTRRLTSG
jgi:hypothetical protein